MFQNIDNKHITNLIGGEKLSSSYLLLFLHDLNYLTHVLESSLTNSSVMNEEFSDKEAEQTSSNESNRPAVVTFAELYQYATSYDIFLMVVGTITASASGFCQPAFCLLFGLALDSLNSNNITKNTNEIVIYLVILGFINLIVSTISVGCWGTSILSTYYVYVITVFYYV